MPLFNEHALEMSIMELFQDEKYQYLNGEQIHRERSEVLLIDDLRQYLFNRYSSCGITNSEVEGIVLNLKNVGGPLYEANKTIIRMLCDGFVLNREDCSQKDIFIECEILYPHDSDSV